jgi:tetratricopeptide (TPR) repeat protein
MRFHFKSLFVLLAVLLLAAGCERPQGVGMTAEIDDPDRTRGLTLLRSGRNQEALAAFLRVIDKRGGDAPESHLDAAQIYHEQIRDPLAAIYHYRKYLELKPNGQKADLVRGRIQAATRDFARTLPAQPLENQVLRNDLYDVVEQLKRENVQLKEELAQARLGVPAPASRGTIANLSAADAGAVIPTRPTLETATVAPAPPTRPVPAATPPPPAASGRRHVVAPRDSLYSIARQYYGTPTNARIQEIVAANASQLPQGANTSLRIGMELVIP